MRFFNFKKIFKERLDRDDPENIVHVTSKGLLYVDMEKQLRTKEAQAIIKNVGSIIESLKSRSSAPK